MQNTDKVSRSFFLKLLVLFALLLSGAMLKGSGPNGTAGKNTTNTVASPKVQEEKEQADHNNYLPPVPSNITSVSL